MENSKTSYSYNVVCHYAEEHSFAFGLNESGANLKLGEDSNCTQRSCFSLVSLLLSTFKENPNWLYRILRIVLQIFLAVHCLSRYIHLRWAVAQVSKSNLVLNISQNREKVFFKKINEVMVEIDAKMHETKTKL